MANALCGNGSVAVPCGDLGAAAAFAECLPMGGAYRAKGSFAAGRVALTDRPQPRSLQVAAAAGQMNGNLTIGKAMRWWEKGTQPNMREVESAQDLAYSLRNAGDRLVVVDFFSPGCGGCRALHPKIAQFAERKPDVLFLQVNYEQHKSMCYSLHVHVHVLPFFRFYRGAQGRVSSFSCTNATGQGASNRRAGGKRAVPPIRSPAIARPASHLGAAPRLFLRSPVVSGTGVGQAAGCYFRSHSISMDRNSTDSVLLTDQEVQGRPREALTGPVQPRPSTGAGGVGAVGSGSKQRPAVQLQREADAGADSRGHQDGGRCNRWPVAAIASVGDAVLHSGI